MRLATPNGAALALEQPDTPQTRELSIPKEITFEDALERARRMSERYIEKGPYEFFPLLEIVDEVQRGLAKNLVSHGRLSCP